MNKLYSIGSRPLSSTEGWLESNNNLHNWVTVINPSNYRLLLQACDDCGVVKSENSVQRCCKAAKGQALLSRRMIVDVQQVG